MRKSNVVLQFVILCPSICLGLLLSTQALPGAIGDDELSAVAVGGATCTRGFKRKYCPAKSPYTCPPELKYNKCKSTEGTSRCESKDGDDSCGNDYRCTVVEQDDISEDHKDCKEEG